jgi:hypothetical protein
MVDGLVSPGLDEVRLVPDAHGTVFGYVPIELDPGGQVSAFAKSRVGMQMLEGAPILHHFVVAYTWSKAKAKKSGVFLTREFFEHLKHRSERPNPLIHADKPVDPHAYEEDHEVTLNVSGHTLADNSCHDSRFLLEAGRSILGLTSGQNAGRIEVPEVDDLAVLDLVNPQMLTGFAALRDSLFLNDEGAVRHFFENLDRPAVRRGGLHEFSGLARRVCTHEPPSHGMIDVEGIREDFEKGLRVSLVVELV